MDVTLSLNTAILACISLATPLTIVRRALSDIDRYSSFETFFQNHVKTVPTFAIYMCTEVKFYLVRLIQLLNTLFQYEPFKNTALDIYSFRPSRLLRVS